MHAEDEDDLGHSPGAWYLARACAYGVVSLLLFPPSPLRAPLSLYAVDTVLYCLGDLPRTRSLFLIPVSSRQFQSLLQQVPEKSVSFLAG